MTACAVGSQNGLPQASLAAFTCPVVHQNGYRERILLSG
jgi:hypothetical protein